MRALFIACMFSILPGLALGAIPQTSMGGGDVLSIVRDGTGVTALVNTLEGLVVRRTTPDGGWGEPGGLSVNPATDAALAGGGTSNHAVWSEGGIISHQRLVAGVAEGEATVLGAGGASVSVAVDTAGTAWVLDGEGGTLWRIDESGVMTDHPGPGAVTGAVLLITELEVSSVFEASGGVQHSVFSGGAWAEPEMLTSASLAGACVSGGSLHVLSSVTDGTEWAMLSSTGAAWVSQAVEGVVSSPWLGCTAMGSYLAHVDGNGSLHIHGNTTQETEAVVLVGMDAVIAVAGSSEGLDVVGQSFGAGHHVFHDGAAVGVPFFAGMVPAAPIAGTSVEILGGRFVPGATSVLLDGDPLLVSDVSSWRLVALIPEDLQGGDHSLTILTSGGTDVSTVLILALPPVVTGLNPTAAFLGSLVVVEGDHLEQATGVSISGHEQEILSTDPAAIVFQVAEDTPLGSGAVLVTTPSGTATTPISVVLPAPAISKLSPNPAVPGGLLTLTGSHLVNPTLVTVGGAGQTILSAENTSVTVVLAADLPLGNHMVQVIADGGTSGPSGPVQIVEPPPEMPVIEEVHPPSVSPGHEFLVFGKYLSTVHSATVNGVEAVLVGAGEKAVRLRVSEALSAGETTLRLMSSKGSVQTPITLLDSGLPKQTLAGASPEPVEWGSGLWLSGSGLESVWNVRIGKVEQEILSAEDDLMQVLVSEDTVGGPQEVIVVGAGASNGIQVLVALENPPEEDVVEPEPDVTDSDAGGTGVDSDAEGAESGEEPVNETGGADGGCRTHGSGAGLPFFIWILLGPVVWRCRHGFPSRNSCS